MFNTILESAFYWIGGVVKLALGIFVIAVIAAGFMLAVSAIFGIPL